MAIKPSSDKITKDSLSKKLFQQIGIPKRQSYKIVQMFFDTIIQGLKEDGVVKIQQFGTFKTLNKNPRMGRNLHTMKPVIIKPRKAISFKTHRKLMDYLNKKI